MAPPFMLVSNFKVKDGSVENLRDYARSVTELMQAKEPRIIAFHSFLSEDEGEMSTIHLHPDVASMELHMQLQRDNWEETFSRIATMLEGVSASTSTARSHRRALSRTSAEPAARSASSPPTSPGSPEQGRRSETVEGQVAAR